MDAPQCEDCKHEIRNALVSNKGLKYRVVKMLIQIVNDLKTMDEQNKRIEFVLKTGPIKRHRTIRERVGKWLAGFAKRYRD